MLDAIRLLFRAVGLWIRGRVKLSGQKNAGGGYEDQGERFDPFRRVVVDPDPARTGGPGAVFQVRFRFKNLSARANRWLSLIPIPLIVAQPGFRSKTWLLGHTSGEFMGRYAFDTVEQAEAYWDSLPLRMMRRRAAPGTLKRLVAPMTAVQNHLSHFGTRP